MYTCACLPVCEHTYKFVCISRYIVFKAVSAQPRKVSEL